MPTRSDTRARPAVRRLWLRLEWLLLVAATLTLAVVLHDGVLAPVDRIVYDRLIGLLARPAPSDIVIIAIDDKSIAELGRWPWKRGLHAQLINLLDNANPRAIGLDLILTETDPASATADRALAAAMNRNRNTILPILSMQGDSGIAPRLPLPALASAAAGLAHIQVRLDEDGRVRAIEPFLQIGRYRWKAFGLALQELAAPTALPQPAATPLQLPFFGPAGHFTQVSYVDVLHGATPASLFHDKTVLVGVTAAGLGDLYPVPAGVGGSLMAGVEIHANMIGALREGRAIDNASAAMAIAFNALPALLVLLAFTLLAPRAALLLTGALTLAIAATSILLFGHDLWLPPAAALLLLWLVYPVWSWLRLQSALRYLDQETTRLAASAPFEVQARAVSRRWDFLERRIEAARTATLRLLDLHQFVNDTMESLPDAELVINGEGRLVLFNRKAQELFADLGSPPVPGLAIDVLLRSLNASHDWRGLHVAGEDGYARQEVSDSRDRIFALRSTPARNARGQTIGAIVSLADITALRNAERQRDLSLNFISHDMRAPQSSILAMLALHRQGQLVLEQEAMFARIEKSVRSTLSLADDFVLLARAKAGKPLREELNLDALLADAADSLWPLARERNVRIDIDGDGLPHWVAGERQMLVRALANLLSNAIKFGPPGGRILCTVQHESQALAPWLACHIDDKGAGLPADGAQLFEPFYRAGQDAQPGIGLGLSFVQTVTQLHGGQVSAHNRDGGGARFTLRLPALDEMP
ncbi:CHASE2 domain-containing protein [Herbaspirillum sp. NPDC087042]|uniref:CHASE2 domain-containing protein n=1 Tax=Herbaspirillum sp. NPDC087042 TaxID=3364004 RepID=UPI00381355B6